jgi:hypothetical protein
MTNRLAPSKIISEHFKKKKKFCSTQACDFFYKEGNRIKTEKQKRRIKIFSLSIEPADA